MSTPAWPYPRWIAHRGAGTLAPENTLAALHLGATHGYRMFECDVKLSADGVPFLLHDATLERTTNGQGPAGRQPWATLAKLDAGAWHSPRYKGEPLPTLAAVAAWCLEHGCDLNIEIKPSPGRETETGQAVAEAVARLWPSNAGDTGHRASSRPPLLSSFSTEALAAAQRAEPTLPRALLLARWRDDWAEVVQVLGCAALIGQHSLWTQARTSLARELNLWTLSYTVNDPARAQELLDWGLNGLITDAVDTIKPGC